MGACVSINHRGKSAGASRSRRRKGSVPSAQTRSASIRVNGHPMDLPASPALPRSFSYPGSIDEAFFDTHRRFRSGSEDDFYSVGGDFTPSVSGSSSPNYCRSSFDGSPRHTRTLSRNRHSSAKQLASLEKIMNGSCGPDQKEMKLFQFLQGNFWSIQASRETSDVQAGKSKEAGMVADGESRGIQTNEQEGTKTL